MSKELVIAANRHEIKVAILEDDQLVEVFFQRANEYSLAGSIHKGRVTRVLPGMQSAFVDLGLERDTFLYVSDFSDETEDFDRVSVTREPRGERGESSPWRKQEPSASRAALATPPRRNRRSARGRKAARSRPKPSLPRAAPQTERTDRGERPDRRWRSRPAFPPPPWPRPWIPGFQVRLFRRLPRSAPRWAKQRPRRSPPLLPPSRLRRWKIARLWPAPAQPISRFSPANLSQNIRARAFSRWMKREEDEIRDLQETSAGAASETLAEIAEEAVEEPDDAPIAERAKLRLPSRMAPEPEAEIVRRGDLRRRDRRRRIASRRSNVTPGEAEIAEPQAEPEEERRRRWA